MLIYQCITLLTLGLSAKVFSKPVTVDSGPYYRPRMEIYNRKNSEFNRLISNQIDFASYNHIIDRPPKIVAANDYAHQAASTTVQARIQREDSISDIESRKVLKKRPCVPIYPHHRYTNGRNIQPQHGSGRTLWDLNFYFLGYQRPNNYEYNTFGSSNVGGSNTGATNKPAYDYDPYGGYDCAPNPFYKPLFNPNNHAYGFGSQNGGSSDSDRPTGGPLGLFGQGGLFDFFSSFAPIGGGGGGGGGGGEVVSGGSGSSNVIPGSGSIGSIGSFLSDENRPAYEINVPDTIQMLNPNNWRPGQLVGGISNAVTGFVQQFSSDISRFIPF